MSDSAEVPRGYNTPIPASIMTPGVVDSRIGRLEFADGVPTIETTKLLWDHLDFIRGVEAFLNCIPAASLQAMNVGMQSLGLDACHFGSHFVHQYICCRPYASYLMDRQRPWPQAPLLRATMKYRRNPANAL